jgi:hypothetical protein
MATSLPTLNELKKVSAPLIVPFHGPRRTVCLVTGELLTRFAAVPLPKKIKSEGATTTKKAKTGGNSLSTATWRGSFVDYETALAYVKELLAAEQITAADYERIEANMTAHLGFTPQLPRNISYKYLHLHGGQLTTGDWFAAYKRQSAALDSGVFFKVPEQNKQKEPKAQRYNVLEASASKTGISLEGANIVASTNNVAELVRPWGDEGEAKNKSFSMLISMDGNIPPNRVVLQQMPTPQHQVKLIGLPSAKDATRVYVLNNVKQKKAVVVAEKKAEPVAEPAKTRTKRKAVDPTSA